MMLLIHCFMYLTWFVGVLCWSLFYYAKITIKVTLCASSFGNNLVRKRERASCYALIVFLMSYDCWCSVAPPHGAVGWSALCDSCIFLSYSLTFFQWRRLLLIVRGCGSVSIDSIFIVAPVYGGVCVGPCFIYSILIQLFNPHPCMFHLQH